MSIPRNSGILMLKYILVEISADASGLKKIVVEFETEHYVMVFKFYDVGNIAQ